MIAMKPLALLTILLALCAGSARAGFLEDLAAANIGATNVTVSFHSTNEAGEPIPTSAVLEWGRTDAYGSRTDEQFASGASPGEPISGLRTLYIDDLEPDTKYLWRVTVTTADGRAGQGGGEFTTLPVDPARNRGPDGTHLPPHTPAYGTPATFTAATWDEVNGLLLQCKGGEVIEVAEEDSSAERTIVLTGGHEDWTFNVLIRPPPGKRASNRTRTVEINSPNITVAGFNLNGAHMYPRYGRAHPGNVNGIGARRAFFWMCTITRNGMLLGNGSPDSGWYEVVALRRGVGGDRAQIKTYGGIAPDNFTLAGCWLEGKDRTNGKDHCDTLQTLGFGKTITGLRMTDTVFFRSANCSGQLTDLSGTLIQNCWFGPLQGRSKVCGSHYATLGACEGAIIRDSDWNGGFRQNADPEKITNSRFERLARPGKISHGNTVGGGLAPQPPPPDLATLWPR